MTATSGPVFGEPFATFDRASCYWRTCQGTFPWGSDEFSETWPRSGMTLDGRAYALRMSARRTVESESSSLLSTPVAANATESGKPRDYRADLTAKLSLLPTPTLPHPAHDTRDPEARMESGHQTELSDVVRMLPTPQAVDYKGGMGNQFMLSDAARLMPTPASSDGTRGPDLARADRPESGGMDLVTTVERLLPTPLTSDAEDIDPTFEWRQLREVVALLPTPAVNDMGDGKSVEWWDEWAPRQKAADGTPAPHGRSLAIEAQRLLPTPTSQDAKHLTTTDAEAERNPHTFWSTLHRLETESTSEEK